MNADCLKLTAYFGERDRAGGRLVSDALHDLYEHHRVEGAVLLRGIEGFGLDGLLHTHRLLSSSEDLPLVSAAIDARERLEGLVPEVTELVGRGLVTLERARMITGEVGRVVLPEAPGEATKLTILLGRRHRAGTRPAHLEAVAILRRHEVAGATVMLGVDGMANGARVRARFFSGNSSVPLVVVAVGSARAIAAALPQLARDLDRPLMALERVRVCKRDGRLLAEPGVVSDRDPTGLAIWHKLQVYAPEHSRHAGHPLHVALIRRLREAGAGGATALRGVWGYSGDHAPHGDRFLSLRRRVPGTTVLIDRPQAMTRWWPIVDELTARAGLVTSELVPAHRMLGADGAPRGGLRLAATARRA